jgi:CxxC motif-containing protein
MKEILCITCPNGCRLKVEETPTGFSVTGNRCERGAAFAVTEMTNPKRTVTTTVRTAFPETPVLPVRTAGEIPKGRIRDLMRLLAKVTVTEKAGIGDAVVKDALGLGVDVIAASNVLR